MNTPRRFPHRRLAGILLLLSALPSSGCAGDDEEAPAPASSVQFEDVSDRIAFNRQSLTQSDGLGGLAWLDYDNDGNLDLYLSNGPGGKNGLFRSAGDGSFADVTDQARVAGNEEGTSGVIAGDLDDDGYIDLVLLGAGGVYTLGESPPVVYHNKRDGTFEDITATSGIAPLDADGKPLPLGAVWSGAMADPDGDGDLDLFITAPGSFKTGTQPAGKFYRNNGDLTFTDITGEAGLEGTGPGQCVAGFSDYDDDGSVDLFVGNCLKFEKYNGLISGLAVAPIQLFRHDQGLHFVDVTAQAKLDQFPGYWMAMTFADLNHDGRIDVFATNTGTSDGHPHGLFINQLDGTFDQISESAGLANFEFAWGAAFTDFDNDGFSDVFFTGSMPVPPSNTIGPGLGNPGRLFINDSSPSAIANTFTQDEQWNAGLDLHLENEFASGVAHGDLDGDGFEDLAIVREAWAATGGTGKPLVLLNKGNENRWVGIELEGKQSNHFGVGARVTVEAGPLVQAQEVHVGTSFASTDSRRLAFGLGTSELTQVTVRWPSGLREAFGALEGAGKVYRLVEGEGQAL